MAISRRIQIWFLKYVNLAHLIFNPATVDPAKVLSIRVSTDRPLMGFELFGTEQGDGLAGLPVSSQTVLLAGKAPLPAKPIYLCELPDPNIYATGATVSNLGAASTSVRAELYNASGAVIRSADFSDVQPRAQLTRMVNQFYGDSQIPAGAAYMKLSAPDKLMGFELYWSMDGPFQFDGILGIEAGSTRHFFPLTRAGDSWASYLRVTDLSGSTNALTVTAYSSAGSVVGTYTGNLPGNGQLKATTTTMFAGKENQIAWIYVSTQGEALANYVYVSSDGARMGSYTAVPADK